MGAKILVIDDEVSVRRVVERMLMRAGYDVDMAADVREAKDRIESQAFDLILCDVHFGGTSGLALLDHARSRQPDTAGMLMTGDPNVAAATEAAGSGVVRYLTKPFTIAEILEAARAGVEVTEKNRAQRKLGS